VRRIKTKKLQASRKLRLRIFERDEWRCWFCGVRTELADVSSPDGITHATLEHLIPKTRAGLNHESNLVTSCKRCNSQKKNRTVEEYRIYLRSLSPTGQAICHLSLAAALLPGIAPAVNKIIAELEAGLPPAVFFGETANVATHVAPTVPLH
jgi:HNH endonuclease